jgi:hypothetical protein
MNPLSQPQAMAVGKPDEKALPPDAGNLHELKGPTRPVLSPERAPAKIIEGSRRKAALRFLGAVSMNTRPAIEGPPRSPHRAALFLRSPQSCLRTGEPRAFFETQRN